ncbi:MAG: YicC/YloC family endoribonuclease [Thermodesulfobacteriota bacterium]
MLKSMTAFAGSERTSENLTVNTEIRSYNSRHLDIVLRIPGSYLSLEEQIKGLIAAQITRGRIEVTVQIRASVDNACAFEIDEARARAYHSALARLRDLLGLKTEIPLELMTNSGIIRPAEIDIGVDASWHVIREALTAAIAELDAMRSREGAALFRDFEERLAYIETHINEIERASSGLLIHYKERLQERIKILTNGLVEIDSGRIAQEAAFLADRSDISEEIVRARSHIQQFREIMAAREPAGRKLNFLLQEFNREFNTMGSKTGNQKVSHVIVDLKSEIEKIREQVQNVE